MLYNNIIINALISPVVGHRSHLVDKEEAETKVSGL